MVEVVVEVVVVVVVVVWHDQVVVVECIVVDFMVAVVTKRLYLGSLRVVVG